MASKLRTLVDTTTYPLKIIIEFMSINIFNRNILFFIFPSYNKPLR